MGRLLCKECNEVQVWYDTVMSGYGMFQILEKYVNMLLRLIWNKIITEVQ